MQSRTPPPPAVLNSSDPFSFEQKIALALQGGKWQELQKSMDMGTSAAPSEGVQEGVSEEAVPEGPPEPTAKQKKKKAQFAKTIARDTGDVLQTIEPDAIVPGPQEVTWDQDPELLCCYNWQASTDDNTIFGKSELLSSISSVKLEQRAQFFKKLFRFGLHRC
jgi:hypothetical protein